MPVRRFWFMNFQIDRINAASNLDKLPLVQCAMGGDGAKGYAEAMKERTGTIVDSRPVEYVQTEESEKQRMRAISGKAR